jgi:hypothetical protein
MSFIPVERDHILPVSSVCIYCGSANGVSDDFVTIAQDVATALAKQKKRIVYGGGHVGLMGVVADTALREGTEVVGIIPEHIRAKEVQHTGLTKLHVVSDMHTRKRMMVEHADAFVILPGGLGTLDEAFEILTWKKLGLHNKPIIIFNHRDFWDPLLKLIDHLIDTKFALTSDSALFKVVTTVPQMLDVLAENTTPHMATLTGRM